MTNCEKRLQFTFPPQKKKTYPYLSLRWRKHLFFPKKKLSPNFSAKKKTTTPNDTLTATWPTRPTGPDPLQSLHNHRSRCGHNEPTTPLQQYPGIPLPHPPWGDGAAAERSINSAEKVVKHKTPLFSEGKVSCVKKKGTPGRSEPGNHGWISVSFFFFGGGVVDGLFLLVAFWGGEFCCLEFIPSFCYHGKMWSIVSCRFGGVSRTN